MTGYWWDELKAHCPKCGTEHEPVRPGKTQPRCECHLVCDRCGGRITHHVTEDPRWPRVLGEWCDNCGPFPPLEDEY